jgi:predicted membrane-bound dolichyl-phosphate-mannose-protein mannosyltransferase
MNDKIFQLMAKMAALEDDLRTAIHEQESKIFFEIKGKRVEFESSVKAAHKQLKTNFFRWLVTNRPQNLITGPIIYAMIIPLLMLDVCVSLYQLICFPVYGVAKVKRSDYIVFDRHQLHYLNFIEKFHCTYCEYGNGLMGYMAEILARTEEYFCPIKHARKVLGTHARYQRFLEYGDAADYAAKLEAYRVGLGQKTTA